MTRTPYDPESEGAQMAFKGRMSYGDYLQLDKILTAQTPLSQAHDEMLFIVQHQASEIWMRLVIHELTSVCEHIARDDLAPSFKKLARVSRILDQLNSAWDVLRTMTPSEYTTFREALGMSSGFQSFQYRAIEFLAGNKNAAMMRAHEHKPDIHSWLAAFCTHRAFTISRSGYWPARVLLSTSRWWTGTGRCSISQMTVFARRGWWSTATRKHTGRSMNWRKSWWILKITSGAGVSTT